MAATTAVAVGVVVGPPARQGAGQAASTRHTTAHHPTTRSACQDAIEKPTLFDTLAPLLIPRVRWRPAPRRTSGITSLIERTGYSFSEVKFIIGSNIGAAIKVFTDMRDSGIDIQVRELGRVHVRGQWFSGLIDH